MANRVSDRILMLAAASLGFFAVFAAAAPAQAAPLSIAEVNAAQVDSVFEIPPADFDAGCIFGGVYLRGNIPLPSTEETGRLHSCVQEGKPGTPGARMRAYVYRIDMVDVVIPPPGPCVTRFRVDFGPVSPLPYDGAGPDDVFVITSGGLGTIKLLSADQAGNFITFRFVSPVCAGSTTHFFGLAATTPPREITAWVVRKPGGPAQRVPVLAPRH